MKKKSTILIIAAFLMLALVGTALAVTSDTTEPLDVDSLDIDFEAHGFYDRSAIRVWPLEGALIGLFNQGETIFTAARAIETTYSDRYGNFAFEQIPWGTWYVREIAAPTGFQLSEQVFVVTISEHGQEVQVHLANIYIRGNITGIKVDNETGEGLAGATIGLFGADETEFTLENALWYVVTGADGRFAFTGWSYGHYQIVELEAPETHILSDEVLTAYISYHGQVVELDYDLVNIRIRGRVEGLKVAVDTMRGLQGAEIALFATGTEDFTPETALAVTTSDEAGRFAFAGLAHGRHYISELASPEGFILSDEVFVVTISDHEEVVEIVIENEPEDEDEDVPLTGDDTELPWLVLIVSGVLIIVVIILMVKRNGKKSLD